MPRKIEFNRDYVLSKSMMLFWKKGFSNTSMREIEKATKLSPPSIYNSFESKEGLFLSALNYYISLIVEERINEYLSRDEDFSSHKFQNFFYSIPQSKKNLGCLLNIHVIDNGLKKEVVTRIDKALLKIEKAIKRKVEQGINQNVFFNDRTCNEISDLLYTVYQGILIIDRTSESKKRLIKRIDNTFKLIMR